MWVKFDNIEFKKGIVSKSGNTFDAWVATGTKQGFQDEPDKPWEKYFFDNQATTIVERGMLRPGCSIVQFLQKGVKPGDTISIKSERDGKFWRITSMENVANQKPTYEPLPEEEGPMSPALAMPSFLQKSVQASDEVPF